MLSVFFLCFLAKFLLLLFALETGNKLLVPQQQQQQQQQKQL
jgi:hypothetical protein